MAARTKSYVTPKYKTTYRVKNWPAYEAGLRKRGDVTVRFDQGCADLWNAPSSGLPGGQRRYSDLTIVTALTLRTVFHLALRQAEGFLGSLIRLMDLDAPDHTTLSRRSAAVDVPRISRAPRWPALAENAMFRYKRIVGDGLRAKGPEAQATEARIAVNVLNRMSGLGMPESEAVVA